MAFVYLRNDVTGQHLGVDGGQLSLAEHCGDAEMWAMVHRDTAAIGSRDTVGWEYTLMSPVSDVVLWITYYIMLSWFFAFLTTLEAKGDGGASAARLESTTSRDPCQLVAS